MMFNLGAPPESAYGLLAKSAGAGIGSGYQQGITQNLNQMLEMKQRTQSAQGYANLLGLKGDAKTNFLNGMVNIPTQYQMQALQELRARDKQQQDALRLKTLQDLEFGGGGGTGTQVPGSPQNQPGIPVAQPRQPQAMEEPGTQAAAPQANIEPPTSAFAKPIPKPLPYTRQAIEKAALLDRAAAQRMESRNAQVEKANIAAENEYNRRTIARETLDLSREKFEHQKSKEKEEETPKSEKLKGIELNEAQDIFDTQAKILRNNRLGSTFYPWSDPKLNRQSAEDRTRFTGLSANWEKIFLKMLNKGVLSNTRFEYLMSLLPKDEYPDRENIGRMKSIAQVLGIDTHYLRGKGKPAWEKESSQAKSEGTQSFNELPSAEEIAREGIQEGEILDDPATGRAFKLVKGKWREVKE